MTLTTTELVERAKHDELLARIDALCTDQAWDDLIDLREKCREAVERGKQLWAVAHHVDYRLALEAPASYAGTVVDSPASRFTLGPLTEVAASTHGWTDLEPHLPDGPSRAVVAQERVVRGEDLRGIEDRAIEVPLVLSSWEPSYSVPEYKPDRVESVPPHPEHLEKVEVCAGERVEDRASVDALLGLVATWVDDSNGTAEANVVEGGALEAIGSLGLREARVAGISPAQAMAIMAWTASDGGAFGQRSGAANGRLAAWWTAATITDLADDWPVMPDDLAEAIDSLNWYWWSDLYPATGWACRLAIEDPDAGYGWVLNAADAK